MKKKYMLAALAFGFSFMTNIWSQVSITYQVDISNAGLNLSPNGIRIGGNFTDLGISSIPNWTPTDPSCAMTDNGNGVWSITVNYPCTSIGQTQLFKFVNGNWGSNEGASDLALCGQNDGQGGYNRCFVIPNSSSTIGFKYDKCSSIEFFPSNVCTINPPNILNDVSPQNNTSLPSAEFGKPYQTNISFNLTNYNGFTVNSYQIADVTFTGNGLNFQPSQINYNGSESGCLAIYGVPKLLGRYNLKLKFKIVILIDGAPYPYYVEYNEYNYTLDVLPSIENIENTTICQGEAIEFNTNLGCGLSYQWKNYNTAISGATTPYFSPTQSGSYSVEISNLTNNLSLSSQPVSVTVNPLPVVSLATFNQFCDTLGLVTLSGGAPSGGVYSGTSVSNNSFNTAIGSGTYPITYNFSDNNGCSSNATSNLTVIDCSGVGFVELTENEISLYPNPTDNILTIEISEYFIGQTFSIYDISGRLLLNGKLNETKTPINVSSFATGTYYVNLPEVNKMMKLIKQ